jgi:[FeFe] hydrogenase H-cluster maturation GTPase HydF
MRVAKSLSTLAVTDIAVWVDDGSGVGADVRSEFERRCAQSGVKTLVYRRGDDVEEFRRKVAAVQTATEDVPLVGDLLKAGDQVLLVCPQDGSAPKGRLILPQQRVVREILDAGAVATVCQSAQVSGLYRSGAARGCKFAITDSQAFAEVDAALPPSVPLTSFSVLFARAKGDLAEYCAGVAALKKLQDGDRVLIAEGCTHHRQCGDIGSVKLPAAVRKISGADVRFEFASGNTFPPAEALAGLKLVIHCGGCMLARKEVLRRIAGAKAAGVPITNYGLALAAANGMEADGASRMIRRRASAEESRCGREKGTDE